MFFTPVGLCLMGVVAFLIAMVVVFALNKWGACSTDWAIGTCVGVWCGLVIPCVGLLAGAIVLCRRHPASAADEEEEPLQTPARRRTTTRHAADPGPTEPDEESPPPLRAQSSRAPSKP